MISGNGLTCGQVEGFWEFRGKRDNVNVREGKE